LSGKRDLAPSRAKKRPYNRKERRKRFLLYCEGEVTEPDYFKDLARFLRSSLIEVEIAGEQRKDPKRLVELAKARRDSARRDASRAKDDSLRYDEVWCVFDGDEHARLKEAVDQATAISIGLAVSNPCFEIWILIHFQDQYSFISCDAARTGVKKYIPDYAKHVDFSKVEGKACEAVKRARRMEVTARKNGKWFNNPSSSVWHLVMRLCEEGKIPIARVLPAKR
jgi:hypothetical protein